MYNIDIIFYWTQHTVKHNTFLKCSEYIPSINNIKRIGKVLSRIIQEYPWQGVSLKNLE